MSDPEEVVSDDLGAILHKARVSLGTADEKPEDAEPEAKATLEDGSQAGAPTQPLTASEPSNEAPSTDDGDATGEATGAEPVPDAGLEETPAAPVAEPLSPLASNFLGLQKEQIALQQEREAFKEELPLVQELKAAKERLATDPVGALRSMIAAVAGDKAAEAEMALFDARTKQVLEGDSDIGKLSHQFREFTHEQRQRAAKEQAEKAIKDREAEAEFIEQQTAQAIQAISANIGESKETYPALFNQRMYDPAHAVFAILEEQHRIDEKDPANAKLPGLGTPAAKIAFGAQEAEKYFQHVFPTAVPPTPAAVKPSGDTKEPAAKSGAASISQVDASEVSVTEKTTKRAPIRTVSDMEDYLDDFVAKANRRAGQ